MKQKKDYTTKLDILCEKFIEYSLEKIELYARIIDKAPVSEKYSASQKVFCIFTTIPLIGDIIRIIQMTLEIYNFPTTKEAATITKAFTSVGNKKEIKKLLSEGFFRATPHFEEQIDKIENLGTIASLSAEKLDNFLRKNYNNINRISHNLITKAIIEEIAWWQSFYYKNSFIEITKTRNFNYIKEEDLERHIAKTSKTSFVKVDTLHFPDKIADFIERDEIDEIHSFFLQHLEKSRYTVIGGLVGMGKTQIAIGYGQKYKSEYHNLIYIDVSSEINLYNSFKEIAEWHEHKCDSEDTNFSPITIQKSFSKDDIPINSLNLEQIIKLAKIKLFNAEKMLLVFDHFNNLDLAEQENIKEHFLKEYDITKKHDIIIVTSNMAGWRANALTVGIFEVKEWSESHVISYVTNIFKNAEREISNTDIKKLGELVSNIPLGVCHIMGYLRSNTFKSANDYIKEFENAKKTDTAQTFLQKLINDPHAQNIYCSLKLTLDKLFANDDHLAKTILTLSSYLDSAIDPKIFEYYGSKYTEALNVLQGFNLIQGNEKQIFVLKFVQEVIRNEQKSSTRENLAEAKKLLYNKINSHAYNNIEFAKDDLKRLSQNQPMLPHLKSLVEHHENVYNNANQEENNINVIIAKLYVDCGNLYFISGMHDNAKTHYTLAQERIQIYYKDTNSATQQDIEEMWLIYRNILQGLGNVHASLLEYDYSIQYYNKLLEYYGTLSSEILSNIAQQSLNAISSNTEADDVTIITNTQLKETIKEKNIDLAKAKTHYAIGGLHCRKGQYFEALTEFKNSLNLIAKNNGFLSSGEQIVESYASNKQKELKLPIMDFLKKQEKAEEISLFAKIFDAIGSIYKGKISEDRLIYDSWIKTLITTLCRSYKIKENSLKALNFYEQAYKINKIYLGDEHPQTMLSNLNRGSVRMVINKYTMHNSDDEPLEIFTAVLNFYERSGDFPIERAFALKYVGDFYLYKGAYSEAEKKYEEVLRISEHDLKYNSKDYCAVTHLFMGHVNFLGNSNYKQALNSYSKATIGSNGFLKDIADDCFKIAEFSQLLIVPFVIKNLLESNIVYCYENIIPAQKLTYHSINKPALLVFHLLSSIAAIHLMSSTINTSSKFEYALVATSIYGVKLYKNELYENIIKTYNNYAYDFIKIDGLDASIISALILTVFEYSVHMLNSVMMGKISSILLVDFVARLSFELLDRYLYTLPADRSKVSAENQWIFDLIPKIVDFGIFCSVVNKIPFENPTITADRNQKIVNNMLLVQKITMTINLVATADYITKLVLTSCSEQIDGFIDHSKKISENIKQVFVYSWNGANIIEQSEIQGVDNTAYEEL